MKDALRRYGQQVYRVQQQGETFDITFDQWYAWWLSHGIDKNYAIDSDLPRPAGPNRCCMVRRNPLKPWRISNVRLSESSGVRGNPAPVGSANPRSRPVSTPAGDFESISAAAAYHGISNQSMRERCQRHPDVYIWD